MTFCWKNDYKLNDYNGIQTTGIVHVWYKMDMITCFHIKSRQMLEMKKKTLNKLIAIWQYKQSVQWTWLTHSYKLGDIKTRTSSTPFVSEKLLKWNEESSIVEILQGYYLPEVCPTLSKTWDVSDFLMSLQDLASTYPLQLLMQCKTCVRASKKRWHWPFFDCFRDLPLLVMTTFAFTLKVCVIVHRQGDISIQVRFTGGFWAQVDRYHALHHIHFVAHTFYPIHTTHSIALACSDFLAANSYQWVYELYSLTHNTGLQWTLF